jgi:glycosyltransferase involved in cell wall biosynthesis
VARIALLHYTLPPVIGGVESIVESQFRVLTEVGHDVRLIAGRGGPPGADVALIPEIDPEAESVRLGFRRLGGSVPPPGHLQVRRLVDRLTDVLAGYEQCWVHNAFTVFLNPFLTAALRSMAADMPGISWVAWCEDASALTDHWDALSTGEMRLLSRAVPGLRYVTISNARRTQLAPVLGIAEGDIDVISPALDVPRWLALSSKMQAWVRDVGLARREPVVLVPSKLLPHKILQMAVRLAHALLQVVPNPVVLITAAASPHDFDASTLVLQGLRRMASDLNVDQHVHFVAAELGGEPGEMVVRDLMLLSDLVFLPSAEEGFSMPVLEAAALRVPILCTDIPAFRETGGQNAHFLPLGAEPCDVAQIVLQVAKEPTNQDRRTAVRSWERFREQVAALADTPGARV